MIYMAIAGVILAGLAASIFSTLTYALRDYSWARLEALLTRFGKKAWLDPLERHERDLIFATATVRLFLNLVLLILVLRIFHETRYDLWVQYGLAVLVSVIINLILSVGVPHALARYAPEGMIAIFLPLMQFCRVVLSPATAFLNGIDRMVRKASGVGEHLQPTHIEQEILSVVEEGEKEGVVDEQEREMIESVISFRDTTAGEIMTARPEIVGLEINSALQQVKQVLEESGHSRLPVYDGTLDHIVGILYARDLLKHLGQPPEQFNIRSAMRQAFYVPETKPLRDLLQDFRLQKVHIAIVLDEYGGTAGLITIEDVLEELVGDISDEHEPVEPAMFKRINDNAAEADARIDIDQINRLMGLNLPEDAGYNTLGGFISTTLGGIPKTGTVFEHGGTRYTILMAEPQRVDRVRIESLPQPAETGV